MTFEIYRYIFLIAGILAGVMLLVTVLIFFLWKIPSVIGDLTGKNERKAIENIKYQKSNGASPVVKQNVITAKIRTQALPVDETTVLSPEMAGDETTLLSPEMAGDETTLLSPEMAGGETTLLSESQESPIFEIEFDITYIHTNEVIL